MRSLAVGLLLLSSVLAGCASLMRPATDRLSAGLTSAVLDQNDPPTVRFGAPAYLLAIDGLIAANPSDGDLLLVGAKLYGAYLSAFVEDAERKQRLSDRALGYARRALCGRRRDVCEAADRPFDEFVVSLASLDEGDVPVAYGFGAAWAGWVRAHSEDWSAIAALPRVEALMARVVELDESHDGGGAHVYLGVLLTQRPASLGGQPERAREHFERAITLSEDRNLMVKVLYAKQYARLVFDRPLHDRLLDEVVAADPEAPGLVLGNTLAQEEARRLLADADEYF